MCCGEGGYAGVVRLEDGRLDVACAVNAGAVRAAGGPGPLAARLLRTNRCPVPESLPSARWRGTPPLTRRPRRVASHRRLAVGDAAGYVEPFTGEGMAWALAGGAAVADLAAAPWRRSTAAEWERRHRRLVADRQGVCRAAAAVLRRPALAAAAVAALAWMPWLAGPVIRRLNAAPGGA
jgi:flavin-dependent dehydrogenase